MSHTPVAVVGVGQTNHKKKRADVSIAGLVREAAYRALADANMDWSDIDAVVLGKAPDLFEGVMKPEMYLADALGAVGKPMFRVHTAGSVGGSTGIVGANLVSGGRHKRVMSIAFEKQSEGNAQFALGGGKGASIGAGGAFAPFIRAYIRRSGAPEDIGWMVAVKDRLNGAKNPVSHLKLADITIDKVKESPMMWDPLHFLESCPSSDGACAVIFTDEDGGKKASKPPAWVLATAMKSEPGWYSGRDAVNPQAAHACAQEIYKAVGITNPREQIDCAELYVPFSWYEPMWLEAHEIAAPGEGWKMTQSGATALDGDFPVNMSGGVLSSNPIGASGLLRFAEAALQVRGLADEHQVGGAKLAIAQAYGANAQFFAMWAVGSSLNPLG